MTALEVERMITADGWYHVATKGSHKHFKYPVKPGKITIPQNKGDLDIKTANIILKYAGLK